MDVDTHHVGATLCPMKAHRIKEVEKMTGIGARTLRTAIHNGLLEAFQPGRGANSPMYVTEDAIRRFQEVRAVVGRRQW